MRKGMVRKMRGGRLEEERRGSEEDGRVHRGEGLSDYRERRYAGTKAGRNGRLQLRASSPNPQLPAELIPPAQKRRPVEAQSYWPPRGTEQCHWHK